MLIRDKKSYQSSGFTLLEIMVALVILATAASGLFASFVAAQKFIKRSQRRLKAAYAAQLVLENLRPYVHQQTWDNAATNLLACDPTYPCTKPYTLPAAQYPSGPPWNWLATYKIDQIDVDGVKMRKVSVKVFWAEPTN